MRALAKATTLLRFDAILLAFSSVDRKAAKFGTNSTDLSTKVFNAAFGGAL